MQSKATRVLHFSFFYFRDCVKIVGFGVDLINYLHRTHSPTAVPKTKSN